MSLINEVNKRRTFAIISHPDAGKTTLTEKLLLMGGAIQTAGAVKSNKIRRSTTSDFMEIERQRGISVSTSVMAFDYKDVRVNILDTPGHKDFAEDTYRTLTAVDSVILVIDSVKGVEEQTRRLMEVCRMRHTPVMVFINKLDREGRDVFELLEELEKELNITVCPFTWPINSGRDFKGVYNYKTNEVSAFKPLQNNEPTDQLPVTYLIDSEEVRNYIGEAKLPVFKEELEMVHHFFEKFNHDLYKDGYMAPVFFGSALNNFGVLELLDTFIEIAPSPGSYEASQRVIVPSEEKLTGFVFKIHANLDPNHRDRIAFLRICSGKFERNKLYFHPRLKKKIRFASPTSFMANTKTVIDEAFPGDVVGLFDNGDFTIGDSLTEGENLTFKGIPNFSPEILREVINQDPFRSKQLDKGIRQLAGEGLAQLFITNGGNKKIIGTVGELQYDVIKFRIEHEYGAKCSFASLPYTKAYWVTGSDKEELNRFLNQKSESIAQDKDGNQVFLVESVWNLNALKKIYTSITFHSTSDFKLESQVQ